MEWQITQKMVDYSVNGFFAAGVILAASALPSLVCAVCNFVGDAYTETKPNLKRGFVYSALAITSILASLAMFVVSWVLLGVKV